MKSRIQQEEADKITTKMDLNLRNNYENVTFGAQICVALKFGHVEK